MLQGDSLLGKGLPCLNKLTLPYPTPIRRAHWVGGALWKGEASWTHLIRFIQEDGVNIGQDRPLELHDYSIAIGF